MTVDTSAAQALLSRVPLVADRAILGATEDSATYALGLVTRYPPPPQGSTYRRTRTLGRSWNRRPAQRVAGGYLIIVGSNANIAPYNRVVQDRDRQARIHQGRWTTAQDASAQQFVDSRIRNALGAL
jgi:hypothetical protein